MSKFSCSTSLPATVVSWRVHAEDDDSRAGGWSAVYTVGVGNGLFDAYLPLVLRKAE